MSTLAINAGSSSLKLGLFSDDTCERLVTGEIDWAGGDRQQAQLVLRPRKGASMCSRLTVPDDATARGVRHPGSSKLNHLRGQRRHSHHSRGAPDRPRRGGVPCQRLDRPKGKGGDWPTVQYCAVHFSRYFEAGLPI